MPERVGVYIDGFNLYYGVRAATGRRFLWLDVEKLSRELLRPHQTLESVTYFTSRVRLPVTSQVRQDTYIDAVRASSSVDVVEGSFSRASGRAGPAESRGARRRRRRPTFTSLVACSMTPTATGLTSAC